MGESAPAPPSAWIVTRCLRGYDDCCPPVVDPSTWLALIAGIALATFFLRQVIITTTFNGRRRKRSLESSNSFWKHDIEEEEVEGWHPLAWILAMVDTYEQDFSSLTKSIGLDEEEVEVVEESEVESSCVVDTWRCASGLLEGGVRHLTGPGGVRG